MKSMKWKWEKADDSTQILLGITAFTRDGLLTDHGEIVFFRIFPTNISVLSNDALTEKINRLTTLLSAQPDIEILCVDATESFDANKRFLAEREQQESNPRIRGLLSMDSAFLEDIQFQTSTAREFLLAIRRRNNSAENADSELNRIGKCISDQGFICRLADRDAIKQVLARYCGIRTLDTVIDDHDGDTAAMRWVIPD